MKVVNLFLSKKKQKSNYLSFLILALVVCLGHTYAQVYPFYNYSSDEGLNQSSIFCLHQDHNNYLWLGSDGGGAIRYNGETFTSFNSRRGLPGNIVRSIFEDSRDILWIGTDNGLAYIKGNKVYTLPDSLALKKLTITDIEEDHSNQLWVATNNNGVYCFVINDSSIHIKAHFSGSNGLLSNLVMDIAIDTLNQVWLAMYGGINVISSIDSQPQLNALEKDYEIPSLFVLSIHITKKGELICGSYDAGAFKITSLTNYRNKLASSVEEVNKISSRIWKVFGDDDGTIWYGTDNNGIIRQKDSSFRHFNRNNGLVGNQFLDIITDNEGITWVSTMTNGVTKFYGDYFSLHPFSEGSGTQINSVKKQKNQLLIGTENGLDVLTIRKDLSLQRKSVLKNQYVTSIHVNQDDIWVGTKENGVFRVQPNSKPENFTTDNGLPDNYINCFTVDHSGNIWIGTKAGICKLNETVFVFNTNMGLIHNEVQDLLVDEKNRIWIATLGGIAYLDGREYRDFNEVEGLDYLKIHSLAKDRSGKIWIGTYGGGLYRYDEDQPDSTKIKRILTTPELISDNIYALEFLNDSVLIVSSDQGFNKVILNREFDVEGSISYSKQNGYIGNNNQLNSLLIDQNTIWFGTSTGLLAYESDKDPHLLSNPQVNLTDIQLFNQTVDWTERSKAVNEFGIPRQINLKHKENYLSFLFEGVSFRNPQNLFYQYKLEGLEDNWSVLTKQNRINYSGLNHGEYIFHIRFLDNNLKQENIYSLPVIITPPFYKTPLFYTLVALVIILTTVGYNRYRTAKLRHDKKVLTQLVEERTAEIKSQKDKIEEQKKSLTDSIEYAEKIQIALLPDREEINNRLDNFIFFRPKDIVSGDFFWFGITENKILISIADCTGHGVPGAFMSMLGIRFLNEIVLERNITRPDEILNQLRDKVIQSLKQKSGSINNKDGMDIALCSLDTKNKTIQYAGANNSLYHFTQNEMNEIKADRMPVSIHPNMSEFKFHEISYQSGDSIYLYSDGYIDQFGGPEGKKFKRGAFKRLLTDIAGKNTKDQYQILSETLDNWTNGYEQVDDISVMGINLK